MRRTRRAVVGCGGLSLLAVGLVAGLFGVSAAIASGKADVRYEVADHDFVVPEDPASLAEGERLYHARGCAECHGEHGEGRVMIDAPPFLMAPPNITRLSAVLSASDWHGLVRHGVYPDGRPLFFMPAGDYARMPDRELAPIVAYVRSLPARDEQQPRSELRAIGNVLVALEVFEDAYPAEHIDHDRPYEEAGEAAPTVAFGAYLVDSCRGCHGRNLSGGAIPGAPEESTGIPSNLTPDPSGLAGWTVDQFKTALRTGQRPDGTEINPRFMPWPSMHSHLNDTELEAMFAYLESLEARPFGGR